MDGWPVGRVGVFDRHSRNSPLREVVVDDLRGVPLVHQVTLNNVIRELIVVAQELTKLEVHPKLEVCLIFLKGHSDSMGGHDGSEERRTDQHHFQVIQVLFLSKGIQHFPQVLSCRLGLKFSPFRQVRVFLQF